MKPRTHDLYLYGDIECDKSHTKDAVTPKSVRQGLEAGKDADRIRVHLFSNGGDVFAGSAIYEAIRTWPRPVDIYIEGLAASCASLIAMAGDTVYMAPTSMMMIHQPWTFCEGNAQSFRNRVKELESITTMMAQAYAARSGFTIEQIRSEYMRGDCDIWLTADEAITAGFADAITPKQDQPAQAVAKLGGGRYQYCGVTVDLSRYTNAPDLKGAVLLKGGNQMAKTKTRRGYRGEAEFIETQCPQCGAINEVEEGVTDVTCSNCGCEYQVESGETEPAEDVQARRTASRFRSNAPRRRASVRKKKRGWFRAESYESNCPYCGTAVQVEEGEQEVLCPVCSQYFKVNTDDAVSVEVAPAAPLEEKPGMEAPQARRKTVGIRSALYDIECPGCGAQFEWDTDAAAGDTEETGADPVQARRHRRYRAEDVAFPVVCPECGLEFDYTPDSLELEDATAPPEFAAAVRKERRRMQQLDALSRQFPQAAGVVEAGKRCGTNVATVQANVLRMASRSSTGAARLSNLKSDAKAVSGVKAAYGQNLLGQQFEQMWQAKGRLKK